MKTHFIFTSSNYRLLYVQWGNYTLRKKTITRPALHHTYHIILLTYTTFDRKGFRDCCPLMDTRANNEIYTEDLLLQDEDMHEGDNYFLDDERVKMRLQG